LRQVHQQYRSLVEQFKEIHRVVDKLKADGKAEGTKSLLTCVPLLGGEERERCLLAENLEQGFLKTDPTLPPGGGGHVQPAAFFSSPQTPSPPRAS